MLDMIKKQFQIRKNQLIFLEVTEVVVFILGVIIQALVIKFDNTVQSVFELGTLIAFIVSLFALMIIILGTFGINFEYAVCMGRTRKSFLLSYISITLCLSLVVVVTGFILSIIEKLLYTKLYPQYYYDNVILDHISSVIIIAVILAEVIIPMFMGALLLKYRMKAFWIMWAIWMVGTVVLPKLLAGALENENSGLGVIGRKLTASLGGINITYWIIIGGFILMIMLISTYNIIKMQQANV